MRFGPVEIEWDGEVLEPRPWTLAQATWAAELPPGPILELGSGAGHIGLAASVLTGAPVVQVDQSPAAARWAARNAATAGVAARVEQRTGELRAVLHPEERFAIVIADPPYVPSSDVAGAGDPPATIDGGEDGLELVRAFVEVAADHLAPGGSLLLQLGGPDQVDAVRSWLAERGTPPLEVVERRDLQEGSLVLLRPRQQAGT